MNHGDFTYTFTDNVGNDNTDSAYDTTLGSMLDNYQPTLVGFFGDDTTGISDVRWMMDDGKGKLDDGRGEVYDLQGRKVVTPTRGLNIMKGKKVRR